MSTRFTILLLIAAIAGLASCKNNDNVFKPVVSTQINVVNASADTLNFFVNGTRQNNSSSLAPGGQTFYLTVPAGSQNYQFKKNGSPDVLVTVPLNLEDSTYTSLYIAGETLDKTLSTPDILKKDSLNTRIRFVHLAPDAGNLNVAINGVVKFSSTTFKSSSQFTSVTSGTERIQVYLSGSTTAAIDMMVPMEPGGGYTIFAKGLLKGQHSAAFGLGVALNF